MDIYLVGGAVRDALLGLPVHERDYVVVGATPDEMLTQGFKQVGRDFPVFLHPDTQDEYALARTERKQGHGYRGFTVHAAPEVTLNEDLARRDLSINAMAMDAEGHLIDPYGGLQDLQQKCLRHVSPAFVEDPLRVLRLARFAARFWHLHFRVAKDTLALAQHIAQSGELAYLQPERIWQEIYRGLLTENPAIFWQTLQDCQALTALIPETAWHAQWQCRDVFEMLDHTKSLPLPRRWALWMLDIYGPKAATVEKLKVLAKAWAIPKTVLTYTTWVMTQLATLIDHALTSPAHLLQWIQRLDYHRRAERWQGFYEDLASWQGKQGFGPDAAALWLWLKTAVARVSTVSPHTYVAQGLGGQQLADAIHAAQLAVLTDYWHQTPLPEKPCWRQTS